MFENYKKDLKDNIKKNKLSKKIEAIFLYGSYATESRDENSDIDILVLTKTKIWVSDENKVFEILSHLYNNKKMDISIYDMDKFQKLLDSGSLFLHHLKNESILVYSYEDKPKEYYFNKLKEFKGISEDILLYKRMLKKVELSIEINEVNHFDLCVLGMIARNTLTVLNYVKFKDKSRFGKFDVFKAIDNEDLNFSVVEYSELLSYRSFFNRNTPNIELPSLEHIKSIFNNIRELILFSMKYVGVIDTIDRFYFLLDDNNKRNLYTSFEVFIDLERDIYMYLKKYTSDRYGLILTSIRLDILQSFFYEYREDCFIKITLQILKHIEDVKKYSSNYSIEFPDINDIKDSLYKKNYIMKIIFNSIKNIKLPFNILNKFLNNLKMNLEPKIENTLKKDLEEYRLLRDKLFK
ncbi:hypothetical protein HMPREF9628_01139 [Peptoanaerobacter stomatis]|uniref:Polymerase beta nucleotidyltransferase domain-containing protein n=1 Tax=Peptoanaerobacter stomatis TaxID=796937 RepID=G9XAX2_9FIRM|nr:nucleotidyltransferase domain-containing protein [Peptoanaerobacter stomatis]EHL19966.1 hypothetical protein HMPREF9628_01139 [Peptoanaerobacter stomatis]